MSAPLVVDNVSKTFKRNGGQMSVLSGISFAVEPGEMLVILGKSGSGKTTLLNIISGLEEPSAGRVEWKGGVSYTPQKDLLLPWRTLIGNVLLPFEIKKTMTGAVRGKVDALLAEVGLSEFKNSYPGELSGGMRQEASLVRSLAQDMPLYVFDESLSQIDFDTRLKLLKKLRAFVKENGKVGIFVTHNIEEAISVADRVIVFSSRPATIVHEARIEIPESDRDPVAIRKNAEFQNQFDTIWKLMAQK